MCGPCRKEENWVNQVGSVRESEEKPVGRELPFRECLNVEAEESVLLEAVARERLVKTAGWKCLAGAVVICTL
jgi:hypothetical protein